MKQVVRCCFPQSLYPSQTRGRAHENGRYVKLDSKGSAPSLGS